jgi:hypothetical protein
MAAFTFLATKRRTRENHSTLSLLALSQTGDGKAISKTLEDWEKDAG